MKFVDGHPIQRDQTTFPAAVRVGGQTGGDGLNLLTDDDKGWSALFDV
ncbi:MAG: hypothetical protein QY302_01375 [Anaerolineales bacterium]|nr:MAG: hypothetical protein QY302_01375 [Anaerolineales bacterium]